MDIAARLMWRRLVLLVVLGVWSLGASAYGTVSKGAVPARDLFMYSVITFNLNSGFDFTSPREAGDAGAKAGAQKAAGGVCSAVFRAVASDGLTFYYDLKSSGGNCGELTVATYKKSVPPTEACPASSTDLGNGQCECNEGLKPSSAQCVPYQCPAKDSYKAVTQPDIKLPSSGSSFCEAGCQFAPSSYKTGVDGQVWGVWPFKSASKTCGGAKGAGGASTGSDDVPPAPVACGANQCPGSVNGTNVCVPCHSQDAKGPSTEASGAQPTDPNNGIKQSETKTTCAGAVCTTTTTYKDGDGKEVGSTTKSESQDDYCAKNPSAPQCKKDSFGGACEGGFTCEGDAVECALAKEVHTRNCQWFKDPPRSMTEAGDAALAGGVQPEGHPYRVAQDAGPSSFSLANKLDYSDRLGGGCPVDTVVSAMGQTLVIPWSQYCGHLQMVGNLAVAVTLLMCAFIVFKE